MKINARTKFCKYLEEGNSSSWGSWGELLAMSSGKRQVSAQVWRTRGGILQELSGELKVVCLGRHVFHPVTPSPSWEEDWVGNQWGWVQRGGYSHVPESLCGLDNPLTSATSFWAAKVAQSIFLLMVLLTVEERGCLPHITSFPFSFISSPDASIKLSFALPLSTCSRPGEPHSGLLEYVSLAIDTIASMPWLLGQRYNSAVFTWITEEVEFRFPAGFDAERGWSVEMFIALCSCMESTPRSTVRDTEKWTSIGDILWALNQSIPEACIIPGHEPVAFCY